MADAVSIGLRRRTRRHGIAPFDQSLASWLVTLSWARQYPQSCAATPVERQSRYVMLVKIAECLAALS